MRADETARLLHWERGLLEADSLPAFLDIAGRPPGQVDQSCTASFVLADPAHELRRLAERLDPAGCAAQLIFVDGLRAVAPQFAALQRSWSGKYQKADHALLFGGPQELSELLMLPLNRGGELSGAFNLGARRLPELARLDEGQKGLGGGVFRLPAGDLLELVAEAEDRVPAEADPAAAGRKRFCSF